VKRMLELLCNEANFLVEAKVQKLLDPLPVDEQNLLKIDSILKVLGIENAADVEKLLSYFLADADNHELIHPNDAIKAIKAFVEDHQRRDAQSKGKQAPAAHAQDEHANANKEEVEFWNRMAGIISDKTTRVWNVRAPWPRRAGREALRARGAMRMRGGAACLLTCRRGCPRHSIDLLARAGPGEGAAKIQRAAAKQRQQNTGGEPAQPAE